MSSNSSVNVDIPSDPHHEVSKGLVGYIDMAQRYRFFPDAWENTLLSLYPQASEQRRNEILKLRKETRLHQNRIKDIKWYAQVDSPYPNLTNRQSEDVVHDIRTLYDSLVPGPEGTTDVSTMESLLRKARQWPFNTIEIAEQELVGSECYWNSTAAQANFVIGQFESAMKVGRIYANNTDTIEQFEETDVGIQQLKKEIEDGTRQPDSILAWDTRPGALRPFKIWRRNLSLDPL